ncbi:MAG: RNase adapter RapZ [Acidimicrobiales bacterium]
MARSDGSGGVMGTMPGGHDRADGVRSPIRKGGEVHYLLITGMSGAGRSTVADALEDSGWYVIDNMPPSLLAEAAAALSKSGSPPSRVALVVGRGGGARIDDVLGSLESLKASGYPVKVLYLDAPDEILVRRFEGTRRRHPVSVIEPGMKIQEAISGERKMLEPVKDIADIVIESGELNVNQLRTRIIESFRSDTGSTVQATVVSFGFKYGVPLDADMVFDCRFLPNPYWVEGLKNLTGLDDPVRGYVLGDKDAQDLLAKIEELFNSVLPLYVREGKSYVTVAIGCTGGKHRSVVLAQDMAGRIQSPGMHVSIFHRDIDR